MKRETCPVCGNKTRDKKGLLHEHANEPPQKYFFCRCHKKSPFLPKSANLGVSTNLPCEKFIFHTNLFIQFEQFLENKILSNNFSADYNLRAAIISSFLNDTITALSKFVIQFSPLSPDFHLFVFLSAVSPIL